MGSAFGNKTKSHSGLDPWQQFVEGKYGRLLGDILNQANRRGESPFGPGSFNKPQTQLLEQLLGSSELTRDALKQQLSGKPTALSGILAPALRDFDLNISPRLNAAFAGRGGQFNNRLGSEKARALGGIQARGESFQAQERVGAANRQAAAIPLAAQQTLMQIQGLGNLQQQNLAGYQPFQSFLSGSQNSITSSPGIGSQLLELGGTIGGAAAGAGACCFIFLESRYGDGTMDSVVRRYRDEHVTPQNQRGYYKLSEVLVPLMRKSKIIRWLVAKTMTSPMVSYGKYFYGKNRTGWMFKPIAGSWLKLFNYLGQDHEFVRENGEVI